MTVVELPKGEFFTPLSLYIYRPAGVTALLPCIHQMHGGGFILGSASEYSDRNVAHVLELGCVFISVDYPLAPETRFAGAIEDCYMDVSKHGGA